MQIKKYKKERLYQFILYLCTIIENTIKTIGGFIMNTLLFLQNIGTPELIILVVLVLLLFGGKKIPELMKGIGKGIKSFKEGVKGIEDEIKIDDK